MRFSGPVDPYAPLEPVQGCDPTPKPGVVAFRDWWLDRWGGSSGGIVRDCDMGAPSKHHEGRAWDWFPPDPETGDAAIGELMTEEAGEPEALARRSGLRTIIWWGKIWIAGRGWIPYAKTPHRDHVHFGFSWAGARAQTSLYEAEGSGAVSVVPFCPGGGTVGRGVALPSEELSQHDRDAPSEPGADSHPDIYAQFEDADESKSGSRG